MRQQRSPSLSVLLVLFGLYLSSTNHYVHAAPWISSLASSSPSPSQSPPRPVVLLHGLMATKAAMTHLEGWLKADFPGIHVNNVEIGGTSDPKMQSLLMPLDKQLESLADSIANDTILSSPGASFTMIGHSQGALLTRSYLEKYNNLGKVHNFVSLAGPQAGVYGVPDFNALCPDSECPWLAEFVSKLFDDDGHLTAFAQKHLSLAEYWKNPFNKSAYLNSSDFLANVNNEGLLKNTTYRSSMGSLTGTAVFVKALLDHIIIPNDSEWFGFFPWGQDKECCTNVTATKMYTEDWIGLKRLGDRGALRFEAVNCTHHNLIKPECKELVYDGIVKPLIV